MNRIELQSNAIEAMETIAQLIKILVFNGYQLKIWGDTDSTTIEFDFADPEYGTGLEWLNDNEFITTDDEIKDVKESIRKATIEELSKSTIETKVLSDKEGE